MPSYAPEYNSDEYLNGHLKRTLAEIPHAKTVKELEKNTRSFMKKLQRNPEKVMSYFENENLKYAA